MKGPSGRRRHPIRRTWECAHCHKRSVTTGRVVQMLCTCTASNEKPVWMTIVQDPRPRPFPHGLETLT